MEDIDSLIEAFSADFEDGAFDGRNATGGSIQIGSGTNQILLGSNPLTSILAPAISNYISENGSLTVGNRVSANQIPILNPSSILTLLNFNDNQVIQFNDIVTPISNNTPVVTIPTITQLILTYPNTTYSFINNNIPVNLVSSTNLSLTSCIVSPSLPIGLSINNSTCTITGTPTSNSVATNYTISATSVNNTTASVVLNLAVVTLAYTFKNAGATGRQGPSQAQLNTAYTGTTLNGLVNANGSGIQSFTIPQNGSYRIETNGAQGASNNATTGLGAKMVGTFTLNAGEILWILVGQQGLGTPGGYAKVGGGGGTFVSKGATLSGSTALIISGGGGGTNSSTDNTTSRGVTAGVGSTGHNTGTGTPGAGGTSGNAGGIDSDGCGTASAGLNGSGTTSQSFFAGGLGALGYNPGVNDGGFGGGGSVINDIGNCSNAVSGGGGGNAGGGTSGRANGLNFPGGGGGSLNTGTSPTNTPGGASAGHGSVIITKL